MILFALVISYNQNNGCFKRTKRSEGIQASSTRLQKHVYGFISFVKILYNTDVYFLFSAPLNKTVIG